MSKSIDLTDEEYGLVIKYRQGFRGVLWHTDDFEYRATDNEEFLNKTLYDRSKFQEALERMICNHDCHLGITWDTIDYYLDEYCIINDE